MTNKATTTTGTTTAMAVLPPVLKPFELCFWESWNWVPPVLEGLGDPVTEPPVDTGWPLVLVTNEVMTMGVGVSPSRDAEGVMTMTDVSTSVVVGVCDGAVMVEVVSSSGLLDDEGCGAGEDGCGVGVGVGSGVGVGEGGGLLVDGPAEGELGGFEDGAGPEVGAVDGVTGGRDDEAGGEGRVVGEGEGERVGADVRAVPLLLDMLAKNNHVAMRRRGWNWGGGQARNGKCL
jgi:hypothetical protein